MVGQFISRGFRGHRRQDPTVADRLPPGAVAPPHVNGGAAYITILAGELTIEGPEGVQTYRAGDTLMEVPGQVYAAANTGAATASLIVTHLIPRGAPVTTVVTR